MKKLVLFFTAVLLTAISANVFAQNSGTTPTPGSTHDYWVNSADGSTHDSGVGNTYAWWISKDASDLIAVETPGTEFTVVSGTYGIVGAVNNYTIELEWETVSNGETFYLVVEETDLSGCSNKKAIAIQPQSNFAIQFVALESDGTTIGDDLSRCAPDVSLSASGTTISYGYGSDNYQFKLIAAEVYTSWSFANAFSNSLGAATETIEYKIGVGGTWTAIATPITVPANATGTEEIYVRVSVVNGTEEGTTAQTMELTLSEVKDVNDTAVTEITDATDADITANPVQTQTVNARPATTGIGSN